MSYRVRTSDGKWPAKSPEKISRSKTSSTKEDASRRSATDKENVSFSSQKNSQGSENTDSSATPLPRKHKLSLTDTSGPLKSHTNREAHDILEDRHADKAARVDAKPVLGSQITAGSVSASPSSGRSLQTHQEDAPRPINITPPREILAKLMTLLSDASIPKDKVKDLVTQAEHAFLNGVVRPQVVMDLLLQTQQAVSVQQDSHLIPQLQQMADATLRDAKRPLEESLKFVASKSLQLETLGSQEVGQHIEALLTDTLNKLQRDVLPGEAMQMGADTLLKSISFLDTHNQMMSQAQMAFHHQTNSLSEICSALDSLMANGSQSPADRAALSTLKEARLLADKAVYGSDFLKELTDEDIMSVGTTIASGGSVSFVVEHAVCVLATERLLLSLTSEQQQVVHQAFLTGTMDTLDSSDILRGGDIPQLLKSFTPDDLSLLRSSIDEGKSLYDAISLVPLVPQGHVSEGVDVQRDMGAIRATLEKHARLYRAKAVVAAKNKVVDNDGLDAVANTLKSYASQLTPSVVALNDNRSARAFETILASELLKATPSSTLALWDQVSSYMRQLIQTNLSDKAKKWVAGDLIERLEERGVRPWDSDDTQLKSFFAAVASKDEGRVISATLHLLGRPAQPGVALVGRVALIRDLWLAMSDSGVAPNQSPANAFYSEVIHPQNERRKAVVSSTKQDLKDKQVFVDHVGSLATRQATGIMAWHQRQPKSQTAAKPAHLPIHQYAIGVEGPTVSSMIRQGAVVASGASGSTNILMAIFDAIQKKTPKPPLEVKDLVMGAAQFLVHDGGHSFSEVMWVADQAFGGKYSSVRDGTQPHSLAQFKAMFADSPEVQAAFSAAFAGLADYRREDL